MMIINKSGKDKVIKLGSKWIHFTNGQVKEGFPEDFLEKNPDYAEDFEPRVSEDEIINITKKLKKLKGGK